MAKSTIEVEIVNKAKGIRTCSVCGREFALISEEHYVARDIEKKGVIPAFNGQNEAVRYDAFDCPHCGCQNVIQERKQEIRPCDFGICDECDVEDENEEVEKEEE